MPKLFEIGSVAVITQGRRAGKKVVIVDIIDENYVLVTGPKKASGVKRRRMNIKHLMPINLNFDIERGSEDEQVIEVIQEREVQDFMQEEVKVPPHRL